MQEKQKKFERKDNLALDWSSHQIDRLPKGKNGKLPTLKGLVKAWKWQMSD